MDLEKADEYMRAHWPAVLLMLIIVIPGTAGVITFFRPDSANGTAQTTADDVSHAKLLDIETRLDDINIRIDTLDKFYRWSRDDENRTSAHDFLMLGSKSKAMAAIPSGTGTTKGTP